MVEAAIDFPWLLLVWFVKAFASGHEGSRNIFPECGSCGFEMNFFELHRFSVYDPDMIVHDHAPQRGAAGGLTIDSFNQEKRRGIVPVYLLHERVSNGILPIFGLNIVGQKVHLNEMLKFVPLRTQMSFLAFLLTDVDLWFCGDDVVISVMKISCESFWLLLRQSDRALVFFPRLCERSTKEPGSHDKIVPVGAVLLLLVANQDPDHGSAEARKRSAEPMQEVRTVLTLVLGISSVEGWVDRGRPCLLIFFWHQGDCVCTLARSRKPIQTFDSPYKGSLGRHDCAGIDFEDVRRRMKGG